MGVEFKLVEALLKLQLKVQQRQTKATDVVVDVFVMGTLKKSNQGVTYDVVMDYTELMQLVSLAPDERRSSSSQTGAIHIEYASEGMPCE